MAISPSVLRCAAINYFIPPPAPLNLVYLLEDAVIDPVFPY